MMSEIDRKTRERDSKIKEINLLKEELKEKDRQLQDDRGSDTSDTMKAQVTALQQENQDLKLKLASPQSEQSDAYRDLKQTQHCGTTIRLLEASLGEGRGEG